MFRKWIAIWIVMIGTGILLLLQANPALAQEPAPENDANCVACHEHQYYLYDSGKWYCLCEAPMHCVYCHGGRTDSLVKEVAHEGIVLYPTQNHAERCQSCHTEDYMARVVTFASVAGISSTPQAVITATPMLEAAATVQPQPAPLLLRISQLGTWRQAALSMLAIALIGILFFGYRCWKCDCLAKSQLSNEISTSQE